MGNYFQCEGADMLGGKGLFGGNFRCLTVTLEHAS